MAALGPELASVSVGAKSRRGRLCLGPLAEEGSPAARPALAEAATACRKFTFCGRAGRSQPKRAA
eukprot:12060406-Alexandrium_andersonii.AAC.1